MNEAIGSAEVWKDIKGYEGRYQISNYGRVWSILRKKILSPALHHSGYYYVSIGNMYGKYKSEAIHRLVALHFCDKPDGATVVNHLDGNKLNNYYENLEWTTTAGNNQHAVDTGLQRYTKERMEGAAKVHRKPVYIYNGNELITVCKSRKEAAAFLNCDDKTILYHVKNGKPLKGTMVYYAAN